MAKADPRPYAELDAARAAYEEQMRLHLGGHPDELVATLGAEVEAAKQAWLADRDNDELRDNANDVMQRYADMRRTWREIGIAAGTRGAGVAAGGDAAPHQEGN